MKKTILLSSILAAGAAFADVTPIEVNSTEVGVIKLAKPTKATLIAVPFLGYEGGDIKVADMINTAELKAGTKLYVPTYSDGNKLTYNVWTLNEDKNWEKPLTTVDISKVGVEINNNIPEASAATVVRGGSYWLEPAAGSGANIYLLGRPTSQDGTSTAVGGKWNLVGNASTATLAALGKAAAKRDQIAIQIDGKFRYYMYMGDAKGWCYDDEETGKTVQIKKLSIPLGQGLWFKPANNSTINWASGEISTVVSAD